MAMLFSSCFRVSSKGTGGVPVVTYSVAVCQPQTISPVSLYTVLAGVLVLRCSVKIFLPPWVPLG